MTSAQEFFSGGAATHVRSSLTSLLIRDDMWEVHSFLEGDQLLTHVEGPLVIRNAREVTASEPRGNSLKGFDDFYIKAKARIWP